MLCRFVVLVSKCKRKSITQNEYDVRISICFAVIHTKAKVKGHYLQISTVNINRISSIVLYMIHDDRHSLFWFEMKLCLTHHGTVNYIYVEIKTIDDFAVGFVDTFSHKTLFILNAIKYATVNIWEKMGSLQSMEVFINLFFLRHLLLFVSLLFNNRF